MVNKVKLLAGLVIVLVILNIIAIALPMLHHGRSPGGSEGPKKAIIERLKLDEGQVQQYEKLIRWHRNRIDSLDQVIRQAKNRLYSQLSKPQPITAKVQDSLIRIITNTQQSIELTHYRHFMDLKNICRPGQMDNYKDLTEDLASLFSRPAPERRP